MEVYELFRDLATLVDIQQESLDVIENRIVHAQEYAAKGEVELRKAEKESKKVYSHSNVMDVLCTLVIFFLESTTNMLFDHHPASYSRRFGS